MSGEAPAVQDLPKIAETLKEQLECEHKLKHAEITEKQVLPTAEDVKTEKTIQGVLQGVESFTPDKLNPVKTREPASGADILKSEIAHNQSLEGVEKFDKNALKHVEPEEKNPLPDSEAIRLEAEHQKFKDGIEQFNKEQLAKAETVEKNPLPTKETIEQEKQA